MAEDKALEDVDEDGQSKPIGLQLFEQVDVGDDQLGDSVPLGCSVKSRCEFNAEVFVGTDHFKGSVFEGDCGQWRVLFGLEVHDFALANVETHLVVITPPLDCVYYFLRKFG